MKRKDIFNMDEIITIVMAEVEAAQCEQFYGIEDDAEIPKPIENKMLLLDNEDYTEFIEIISEISEDIYELKSGELNELNKCHEEIAREADIKLNEFIEKE
ncbi:MAG: hypothetical protein Q4F66_00230 [Clostridium sp.]|nr:hypothetical protein [Clostridium sp.]